MKFRMVDRILAWQPRRSIRGLKVASFEEYQLKEPLADEPCLPETLLVESLFQLGNWLVVLTSDFTEMAPADFSSMILLSLRISITTLMLSARRVVVTRWTN